MGRPRLSRASACPTFLSAVAEDAATDWAPMTLAHYWYGEGERASSSRWSPRRRSSGTAAQGCPRCAVLRWVLMRDPQEELFETQALLRTDLDAKPERIMLLWFV